MPAASPPAAEATEAVDTVLTAGFFNVGNFRDLPSWLVSMVFHLLLVIGLALYTTAVKNDGPGGPNELVATLSEESGELESLSDKLEAPEPVKIALDAPAIVEPLAPQEMVRLDTVLPPMPQAALAPSAPPLDAALADEGTMAVGQGDGVSSLTLGDDPADMLKGRLSSVNRARLIEIDGGTPDSEAAVERALKWLATHQMGDGGWAFDHSKCPKCQKKCSHPGNLEDARIAATAMALLPFLGQGHTQKSGDYKTVVDRGLYFLTRSMKHSGGNGSLHESGGRMYGHGLASIALCEAYGLTQDPALKKPAQAAINYIVMAQDPQGGGWRYNPRQPGDTSVVGWQLMALKSGHMAYLRIPEQTVNGASAFLNDVQDNYGATYGYTGPGGGAATSAIGLLCRLYLGWPPNHDPMRRGVEILERMGPSIDNPAHAAGKNNMYYNYYATQVLHHTGGYPWQQWNAVMRDYLVKTQARKGHEAGSWYLDGNDQGMVQGGRLYCTSLAAMTLEVYYRHLPLYRKQTILDNFGK